MDQPLIIFRQKLIVRCLESLFPPDRPDLVIQLFKEAAVQPMKRPIQVSSTDIVVIIAYL